MDSEYLIIYAETSTIHIEHHAFLETEEELMEMIDFCNRRKFDIIFAAKIAVVKEFIG